jgi:hypothetical protein
MKGPEDPPRRRSAVLLTCLIWVAGVSTPIVVRVVPSMLAPGAYGNAITHISDVNLSDLLFALWDSLPFALLALLKAEIDRDQVLGSRERLADNAGIATAFIATLCAEAWAYHPLARRLSPFALVPLVVYPLPALMIVILVYAGVRALVSALLPRA